MFIGWFRRDHWILILEVLLCFWPFLLEKKHNLNLRPDFTSICMVSYECMLVRALINEWLFYDKPWPSQSNMTSDQDLHYLHNIINSIVL